MNLPKFSSRLEYMKKVEFCDLSLRDGQQSLFATRMTTAQGMSVIGDIVDAGFSELELWGGATIDAPLRFLKENPWERLDQYYKITKGKTSIRALIRGQNLFAYSPYPDSMIVAFCKAAIKSGIGTMRMFDALNDRRNLMMSLLASKAWGAKTEVALSYTTSPIHTTEWFVKYAGELENDGADVVAIKDMAGLLSPKDAAVLIPALKKNLKVPITLHSHTTVGFAETTAIVALLEGCDRIDTAIGAFAGGLSHAAIELISVYAELLGIEHGLDHKAIERAGKKLLAIRKELAKFDITPNNLPQQIPYPLPPTTTDKMKKAIDMVKAGNFDEARRINIDIMTSFGYPKPDEAQLNAQVPGGMYSNLYSQLNTFGQLELLPKILEEVEKVRSDTGYPPLVTPTSQIVGSQATFNIQTGERYKVVSREFRDMVIGRYGKTGPMKPEFVSMIAGKLDIYKERSGHYVNSLPLTIDEGLNPPEFIKNHRDLLLYYLLPQPTKEFFESGSAKPSAELH